ncbi:MAG: dihydrodipicolinate synthase family protein [Bacillota bacterium]
MFVLRGVYAPIPTPFVQGEISFEKLKSNIRYWAGTDLEGLVVLGSNGEAPLLDFKEKTALISHVREYLPENKKVIAGTGCESARETLKLSKAAADEGADAVLVINPNYYKSEMKDENLKAFYIEVAEKSQLPVILYNMPRNTGVNLSSELVVDLSYHQNIIGIKDSSGNIAQMSEIAAFSKQGFVLFAGSASFLLPSLLMGATGGTLAAANIAPGACCEIIRLFNTGDFEGARKMQQQILPVNKAVTSGFGVAGLKAAMDMLGLYGGEPRLPLLPLTQEKRVRLREILINAQVLKEG